MKLSIRLVACLCLAATLQAADPMAEIFSRIDAAASKFKGMTADLTETVHVEIVDDNNVSRGTIKLRRAKGDVRFLVKFDTPEVRSAAYSGNDLNLYTEKTNTWDVIDVTAKKSMIEQLMLLGFGATSSELKATYDVSFVAAEAVDGQPTEHIRLVPKSKDMLAQLKQADLWISDALGIPVQQKFQTTKTGDYNLFQYRNLKLAPGLSDDDLKLKVPKNAVKKRVGAGSAK